MRRELIAQLGGVDPSVVEGEAETTDSSTSDDVAKSEARALAIDPAKQFEILNPKEFNLRCEMFYIDWYCDADTPHITTQDDRPKVCSYPTCRSQLLEPIERIDVEFFELRLAFSEVQVHRRRVFEHIEHYAQIIFAEMLRHHPTAVLTAEWLDTHRGYYEAAVSSPQARMVLRELLVHLNPKQGGLVDGMTEPALVLAARAIIGCRFERNVLLAERQAAEKKTTTA